MTASSVSGGGAIIPFAPQQMTTPEGQREVFSEDWAPADCYQWIDRNMDKGLLLNESGLYADENKAVLEPFDKYRDLTPLVKKYACFYETTGNNPLKVKKRRIVHANQLFYAGINEAELDSGLWRTQTPGFVKRFYSWLLYKGKQEQRVQHLFNLVHSNDQRTNAYNMYYHPQGVTCVGTHQNKGYVRVEMTSNISIPGGAYAYHALKVRKLISVNEGTYENFKPVSEGNIKVTNYTLWPDAGVIDLESLDGLAAKVIEAKMANESPVIHCLAGKGRTGTLSVAVILKEEIESGRTGSVSQKTTIKARSAN